MGPMTPEAMIHLLSASLAGGLAGFLVLWNRRQPGHPPSGRRGRFIILFLGTLATGVAVRSFALALGAHSRTFAVVVLILVAEWAALLQSAVQLPVPTQFLRVGARESALLRSPWVGVRAFGAILRHTPLRKLGGSVYLGNGCLEPRAVLLGIHTAERVHLWALLLSLPWLVAWALLGYWGSVGWGLALQLPLHVYPLLHLRHATGRVERHLDRGQGHRTLRSARRPPRCGP